jgi:DNA processing protein
MATNSSNTTNQTNLHSWLLLYFTPKVGPITMLKLLHHFGTAKNILEQDSHTLSQFINPAITKLIKDRAAEPSVIKALDWQQQSPNNHLITLEDPRYPKELKQIVDPPLVLFGLGKIELLKNSKFAIVGTRHNTSQGAANAHSFAYDLSNNGLTIVSGMAYGIDRHAHMGALKGKASTIGVIGTGIDVTYPKSNKDLYAEVAQHGLILSEFALTTQPLASNFPRRNRIVAGLSLGCLVVESTLDGGSLITANMALDMGREVMAIPGLIHSPVSHGCHKLIKTGAKLVENTNDVLDELPIANKWLAKKNVTTAHPILDIIGYDAVEIDKICTILNTSFADICPQLLELELDGHIVNCGNGKYQRIFK